MIDKLTPEQESKIPEFIDKWVNKASEPMDVDKAKKYTGKLYSLIKEDEPIIIVGDSPINTTILAALFFTMFKKEKASHLGSQPSSQLNSQLSSQLASQLASQLGSQLSSQLRSQISSKLHSQLDSQLDAQLDSKLGSQLNSQLGSQPSSQLRSQLNSQLDSKLHSQLRSQLNAQIRLQLNSQLNSKLYSQLDSQLNSQLHSQLSAQIYSQLRLQISSQLRSQIYSQLRSQLRSQLDSKLYSQLYSKLGSQLDSQLTSQLGSQLGSQLDSKLYSQLDSQLGSQLTSQLKDINEHWYLGLWWLTWCGWYDYGKFLGVKFDNYKYDLFLNFTSEVHFIIPYKGICFISEKPTEINWENQMLHKDGGMAVKYKDGYGMYCLNGIKVPEYLAITPESELDIDFFKKETNADIKAEFIRKFGIERMLDLGKKIDSYKNYEEGLWIDSEYELWDMANIFESIDYAPHLRMKNLSTGTWHLEGVSPECRSLEQALRFRMKGKHKQLTDIK